MAKCPCPCPLVGGGTCGRFGSDTNKSGYVPGPRSTGIARDDTHVYVCPFHRKGWWAQKRGVTGAQEEKKLVQQYILQWDCGFATSIRAECAPSLEQPPAARCPSRKVSQCGRGRPPAPPRAQPPKAVVQDGKRTAQNSDSEAEEDAEEEATWVECDACGKWRELPPGVREARGSWTCAQNSDARFNQCDAPQDPRVWELEEEEQALEQPPAAKCPSRKVSQCGRGRPQAQRPAQPPTAATKLPTPTCAPPKEDPAKEREIQVLLHQLHTLECEVQAVCGQCHELKSEIENTHWRPLANVDSLSRRVSTNL